MMTAPSSGLSPGGVSDFRPAGDEHAAQPGANEPSRGAKVVSCGAADGISQGISWGCSWNLMGFDGM